MTGRDETLAGAFQTQAARVGATVHRSTRAELPALTIRILRETGCRTVALAEVVPQRPAFAQALHQAGLALVSPDGLRPTRRADAGISFSELGVAETGSVLLRSTADDRRVELCVDVHVVLLEAVGLVSTLDLAFAALREVSARPPVYATLVSGPSRSADIERHLTIGVHGPRALHVLLWKG